MTCSMQTGSWWTMKYSSVSKRFYSIATRVNPDPLVTVDQATGDQTLADLVRNSLSYQADRQKLRMLLKGSTRDWALRKLGVIKLRWDNLENDIASEVINPMRMILDRDGYVKEGGILWRLYWRDQDA